MQPNDTNSLWSVKNVMLVVGVILAVHWMRGNMTSTTPAIVAPPVPAAERGAATTGRDLPSTVSTPSATTDSRNDQAPSASSSTVAGQDPVLIQQQKEADAEYSAAVEAS